MRADWAGIMQDFSSTSSTYSATHTSTIYGHQLTLRRPLTNVDEVRGGVLALPPQPVNLVPGHLQAWAGDSELDSDASTTRMCSRAAKVLRDGRVV